MSVVEHAPNFGLKEAAQFAKELYGLSGTLSVLPSERDQNFLVSTDGGERYVLKIANATEEQAMLDAQDQMMAHAAGSGNLFPKLIVSARGENIETVLGRDGRKHFVRLVTYLNGTPLGNVKRHSPELMFDLGRKLGELDNVLQGFEHPALHRDFHWDFANGLEIVKKNLKLIRDKKMRAVVSALAEDFEKFVVPLLLRLPKSAVYNDANDYNILVGGGEDIYSVDQSVTGFIDLGDMVFSYTVGDLAIAIAYAILDKPTSVGRRRHCERLSFCI